MEIANLINLTPHAIKLCSGLVIKPSGNVLRVEDVYEEDNSLVVYSDQKMEPNSIVEFAPYSLETYILTQTKFKKSDLPEWKSGVMYIVSAIVLNAIKNSRLNRHDFVAPATGHPLVKRNAEGQIVSVPGFVRLGE